jgi:hypothetical protein
MQVDGADTAEAGEGSLTSLQVADGVLENVVKCPDCSKPILQSAMEDHSRAFSPLSPLFHLLGWLVLLGGSFERSTDLTYAISCLLSDSGRAGSEFRGLEAKTF